MKNSKKRWVFLAAFFILLAIAIPAHAMENYEDEDCEIIEIDGYEEIVDVLDEESDCLFSCEEDTDCDTSDADALYPFPYEDGICGSFDIDFLTPFSCVDDFYCDSSDADFLAPFSYEDGMQPMSVHTVHLDAESYLTIKDYEKPIQTIAAGVSRKELWRSCSIRRASDGATLVQWVLNGIFAYNGKSSACIGAQVRYYNNAPSQYSVTASSARTSGKYAIGNCKAIKKSNGKVFSNLLKIGISPSGTTLY